MLIWLWSISTAVTIAKRYYPLRRHIAVVAAATAPEKCQWCRSIGLDQRHLRQISSLYSMSSTSVQSCCQQPSLLNITDPIVAGCANFPLLRLTDPVPQLSTPVVRWTESIILHCVAAQLRVARFNLATAPNTAHTAYPSSQFCS